MIADFAHWLGGLWGDQREYLTCNEHGGEFPWNADGATCPIGGCELRVHVSRAEAFELRFVLWRMDWLPHRTYVITNWQACEIDDPEWGSPTWHWPRRFRKS